MISVPSFPHHRHHRALVKVSFLKYNHKPADRLQKRSCMTAPGTSAQTLTVIKFTGLKMPSEAPGSHYPECISCRDGPVMCLWSSALTLASLHRCSTLTPHLQSPDHVFSCVSVFKWIILSSFTHYNLYDWNTKDVFSMHTIKVNGSQRSSSMFKTSLCNICFHISFFFSCIDI